MAGTAVNARCGSDKKIKVYRMDDLDFLLLLGGFSKKQRETVHRTFLTERSHGHFKFGNLFAVPVVFHREAFRGKFVEIGDGGIQSHLRCVKGRTGD